MPRYVILDHDWPEPHLDLMLENEAALLTWRLPPHSGLTETPVASPLQQTPESPLPFTGRAGDGEGIPATRLPDHRLAYLDYEGPVSGNRGRVQRIDAGEFQWLERGDGRIVVETRGGWCRGPGRGRLELIRIGPETVDWRLWWSAPLPPDGPG